MPNSIRDSDILFAENLMGVTFNHEQRDVLKCDETMDIVACPGSGKTTTLVAKLAILARKGQRGICVLSHTNVARREIEAKLGKWASVVCDYPNFVGTIQSFVHTYAAIPGIAKKYGIRPWAIDDDTFRSVAAARYGSLPRGIRFALDQRTRGNGVEAVQSLRLNIADPDHVCVEQNGQFKPFPYGRATTDTYTALNALKQGISQDGCFAFRDAFAIGHWYAMSRVPLLQEVLGSRFPYVFIDEMQDTDRVQADLLSLLLARSTVQRFGDPNQAIYGMGDEDLDTAWAIPERHLSITYSSRLSPSIAEKVQDACLKPQELKGNPGHPERHHTIFLFDETTITRVLGAFGDRIAAEGFDLERGDFCAVGAWKKANDAPGRYRIPSYWPEFADRPQSPTVQRNTLADYFLGARAAILKSGSSGAARTVVLAGLLRLLRIEGITHPDNGRTFSERSYLRFMQDRHPSLHGRLLSMLSPLMLDLADGSEIDNTKVAEMATLATAPFLERLTAKGRLFVTGAPTPQAPLQQEAATRSNVFRHETDRGVVPIRVSTIHGVKGETHQATLLLETFSYEFDLEKVVEYLIGSGKTTGIGKRLKRALTLDYVAMTRPTELLCLAIHRDHVSAEQRERLQAQHWEIVVL